ncbi:MAG: extracellular solute-binding protein [Lachnospiraceae bacterium]|nr:extracellular solute-binding protein [Lachnospiraceae bacterium]
MILSLLLLLAGCTKKEENKANNTGGQEEQPEPVTFDWYVNYSWFVTSWGGNVVSDTITRDTGVTVNFISPPGNEAEKLNALIASDSLPDLITLGWWEPQYAAIVESDMVYALNELADKYDPYFYEVADQTVCDWYRWADGNVYCYPNSSFTPNDLATHDDIASNQTFLVRKDIYEAIGSPDMTTPEGFYQAVKDAYEKFPMVGSEALIPIGAHVFDETGCVSFDQYLMNFLAIPYEKDGEYYDRYTDEEYLRWLKMFRKLSYEGYLSPDVFVDSRTQMSEKIANGRYFCMLYQRTDLADQQKLLYEKDPDSIYIAVDGPANSKGDAPILPSNGITGWTITLISKNCAHPDRAIKFFSYLLSEEGQKLIYLGVEGETYTEENGVVKLLPDVEEILNSDREKYNELYGADDTYWMLQNNVMQLKWKLPLKEPMKQLEEWTYPYTRYLGQYEVMVPKDPELASMFTKCDKLWSKTLKELLLAKTGEEFDTILDNYKTERVRLGFEKVMEEKTRQMRENKARLKME